MSFYVSQNGINKDSVILLEDKEAGTKAEIYVFGALLNRFLVKQNGEDKNVIYGFQNTTDAQQHITPLFQGAKLSPFVCRLKEGSYTFGNQKYKIEKYYNGREAIHGLVYDAVFTMADSGASENSAYVTLTFDYNKTDAGFPFFYRLSVTYRLQKNNRLSITTNITNLSNSPIPVADGWHPYFSFGKKVDELYLSMNTLEIVEFDSRLLPTGRFTPYNNFALPLLIEATKFDHCFVLNENHPSPACSIRDEENRIGVKIYAEKNYPFLQVFIPDNRNAIAIENLSSVPDSFNNAIGLIILEPSQSSEFITTFEIETT